MRAASRISVVVEGLKGTGDGNGRVEEAGFRNGR
jgi:hypothetical protein